MNSDSQRQLGDASEAVKDVLWLDMNRYPLVYLPRSTTQVNRERLPSQEEMVDMELAAREQACDDEMLHGAFSHTMAVAIVAALVLLIVGMFVSVFVPPVTAASLSGLIAFAYLVLRLICDRTLSLRTLLTCVLVPIAVLMVIALTHHLLRYRILGAGILMVAGAFSLYFCGSWPFRFYHEWLHTHPQVTPEMRRKAGEAKAKIDFRLLLFIIPAVLLLPMVSPMLTVVVVCAVCGFACRHERCGLDLLPIAQDVAARFATYAWSASGAPGMWHPQHSVKERLYATIAITLAAAAPLSVGLCYYFPCRPLAYPFWSALEDDYRQARGAPHYVHPDMCLEDAPKKSEDGPSFLAGVMINRPHVWPLFIYRQIIHSNFGYCWLVLLVLFLAITVPPWVLLALYRPCLLEAMQTADEIDEKLKGDERPEWQWYVDRLRMSNHTATDPLSRREVKEAEHMFLGVESVLKFPALLDKRILNEHAYIVGETGSGKTSLGIMPLLIQLIRGHAQPGPKSDRPGNAAITPPPPMVIIDLKGDPALFHTVKKEAADRRQQLGITEAEDPHCAFRFFTSEKGKDTHHFNPFKSLESTSRSLIQLCHLFLDSLGLSHGEGYGRSYYSRKNRHLLYEALKADPQPRSFEELFERIMTRAERQPQVYRDCFELVSTIHALSKYPQIAAFEPLKRPQDAIHMPSVIEYGQIVYFWLPGLLESISVREIAKLALYSLLTAAIDRQRQGLEAKQVYLVIDEFQRIAGENFRVILEQARSFKVSAILANQSQGDLKTPDVDLRPTIRSNTRFKQYFGLSDPREIADLCDVSGQEVAALHSWEMEARDVQYVPQGRWEPRRWFSKKGEHEFIKTRITVNDIISATDHPLDSIVQVSRGEGYTQFGGFPFPMRSVWPMHYEDYGDRQKEPWPTREDYELETVVAERGPSEIDQDAQREAERLQAQMDEAIQGLFARCQAEQDAEAED
ncbi:MAG: hypothetical protein JXQ75_15630 [Phycisphaerae bacterium]|nr:hypothetical protein [Phycisphaerae bacterium]